MKEQWQGKESVYIFTPDTAFPQIFSMCSWLDVQMQDSQKPPGNPWKPSTNCPSIVTDVIMSQAAKKEEAIV